MKVAPLLVLLLVGCGPKKQPSWFDKPPFPIERAIQALDYAEVEQLTRKDPDSINRDFRLDPPLILAIRTGQFDVVDLLIQRGAEVRGIPDRATPLENAIERNDLRIAKLLLLRGSGTGRLGIGVFPIHVAAQYGRDEAIRLLLGNGADVDTISPFDGQTPLQKAIPRLNVATVRLLLSKGANPNVLSYSGTALDMVENGGFYEYHQGKPIDRKDPRISEIRRLLLDHGAKKRWDLPAGTEMFDQAKFLEEHPEFKPQR